MNTTLLRTSRILPLASAFVAASLLLACGGSNSTPTEPVDAVDPGTWEDLTFTETPTVPCGLPDLAVTRVGSRVERSQSQCTVLNWRFTVKNVGSGSAVGATVRLQIIDDGLTTQDQVLQLPVLAVSQSIQFEGSILTFAGVATVVVMADPADAFFECNESNNVRSKTVTCNG